jgi:type I restriction enzyme S subunit
MALAEFQAFFKVPLRNGLTRPKAVRGVGVKMMNMGEIFAHDRIGDIAMDRVLINEREVDSFLLERGDLLFARQSLVLEGAGKCSIFLGSSEPVTFESHIIRARLASEIADPAFFYYFFKSPSGRGSITSIVEQVAAAGIRSSDLARLAVPHVPLARQQAIAHILGTLDDKIELNRRMNETLEAMARALFKSWFVDFNPVRTKGEGRDPGLAREIAELFPDRFQDSELREIPAWWEVKTVGDLAEVVGGSTPSTSEPTYWDKGVHHWATPKDLSALAVPVLLDTERRITDAGLAQVSSGLLPAGTVLLSSRAPIGYLAITEMPVAINQGFIAMKPRKGVSNLFLLLWASFAHEEILSHANGSTFLEISKANFRPISVVTPPTAVFVAFDRLTRPLYLKMVSNECEARTLAALRDTLLPKLISGELRVERAERFIGRCI